MQLCEFADNSGINVQFSSLKYFRFVKKKKKKNKNIKKTCFWQALIAFGSNVNMQNDQGESPRHLVAGKRSSTAPQLLYCVHAVGAKRCSQKMPKCGDGCSPTGNDDGQSSSTEQIPRTRHLFDAMLHQVCQHSATANQGS